jgi:peptidyl-prolyl cis-trans isomerase SurA
MKSVLSAVLLTLIAGAPIFAQRKVDQIAARVNGDIILKSDIDRKLEEIRGSLAQAVSTKQLTAEKAAEIMEETKTTVLRDLIDDRLLVQIAKEAGLNADLDVFKTMQELQAEHKFATMDELERAIIKDYGDLEEFKESIRTRVLSQQVKQHEVYRRIVITNEEMRKYYDEHQKDFDKPAGVRLSEIAILADKRFPDQVATQRKKAEEALAAIRKGDEFAEVAKKYSEVPSAERGGDMGFLPGELNEDLQKVVAKLSKNQVSDIFEVSDGFEIIKVTDKHAGGILTFELAQSDIQNELMYKYAPPKEREFLTKLREEGFVEVKEGFKDAGDPKAAKAKPKTTASTNP